ncbi:hypothetical protein C0995_013491 [Termitomyces sp. Mi166|nr:hypothetical protein C0995_013491 [Termitomyces sp. Mi166\
MLLDLSCPLATLLQKGTHHAHKTVANSPGTIALVSGHLSKEEYIKYLLMLWHIYNAFEQALDQHTTHPTLEPTYSPTLLAHGPSLSADIAYLLGVPEASWKNHPMYIALLKDTHPALKAYVDHVRELAGSPDPLPLLAHAYVRYLGDLSGGQKVHHAIVKAYDLDGASGEGLSFYAFKELNSTKLAMQDEMKRIKEWFRDGMNKAGEQGDDVKASIVREANIAFDLNTELLNVINAKLAEAPKDLLIAIEQPSQEKTYPIYQVISVIVIADSLGIMDSLPSRDDGPPSLQDL